ncbi:MAG: DUF3576 domain-containing protein [Candidatus Scalindua sp.]|nr:DUF3576 domain-containing protein [Candidatus Scalindua sp.]
MKISYLLFTVSLIIGSSGCLFTSHDQARDLSGNSRSSQNLKSFQADFETVWSAAIIALDGMPLEKIDKEKGVIKTGWIEGWSQREARSVLTRGFLDDTWKARRCLIVTISPHDTFCSVKVICREEERPRGGSSAYRWRRVQSSGEMEEEFLTHVEEILGP